MRMRYGYDPQQVGITAHAQWLGQLELAPFFVGWSEDEWAPDFLTVPHLYPRPRPAALLHKRALSTDELLDAGKAEKHPGRVHAVSSSSAPARVGQQAVGVVAFVVAGVLASEIEERRARS